MNQSDPGAVKLRPLTTQPVESILLDAWPGHAAVVDFGLDSQQHYEALYYPVRSGEITPEQLEKALGDGPALTRLANDAPSNPHRGIVFRTSWDVLLIRPTTAQRSPLFDRPPEEQNPPEQTRDRPRGR